MSIIPVTLLSRHDLRRLGNNLCPARSHVHNPQRAHRPSQLAAINRSLAPMGERVARLYARSAMAG